MTGLSAANRAGEVQPILRKAEASDREAFVRLQTDRYYGCSEGALAMIDAMWRLKDTSDMRIYTIDPGMISGFIVVSRPEEDRPNIGIDIFDEYTGRGLGYRAMRELPFACYVFETEINNREAMALAQKLELVRTGEEMIEGYRFVIWEKQ